MKAKRLPSPTTNYPTSMIASVVWIDTPGIPPIELRELVVLSPVSPPTYYRGSVTTPTVALTVEVTKPEASQKAKITASIVAAGIPESEDWDDVDVPEDVCLIITPLLQKTFTPHVDIRQVQIRA